MVDQDRETLRADPMLLTGEPEEKQGYGRFILAATQTGSRFHEMPVVWRFDRVARIARKRFTLPSVDAAGIEPATFAL
jgi:hypothetical protein